MNHAQRHPRVWQCYFLLVAVILIGKAVSALAGLLDPGGTQGIVGVVIGVIGLVPLYGFIQQRRFDPRWLWQLTFGIDVCLTGAAIAICVVTAVSNASAVPLLIGAGITLLAGPSLFAQHQYLYRSPRLWG